MRSSDSGYAHGTIGSPQSTINQSEYAAKVAENEEALKRVADSLPLVDDGLTSELDGIGVKYSKKDVVFITRDRTGQLVWLERGNRGSGLEHMEARGHIRQLAKCFNVSEQDVLRLVRNVIRDGKVISNTLVERHGRKGYERVYEYAGRRAVLAAIGTNGFVVTVYPR